jgi:hypothetical protein
MREHNSSAIWTCFLSDWYGKVRKRRAPGGSNPRQGGRRIIIYSFTASVTWDTTGWRKIGSQWLAAGAVTIYSPARGWRRYGRTMVFSPMQQSISARDLMGARLWTGASGGVSLIERACRLQQAIYHSQMSSSTYSNARRHVYSRIAVIRCVQLYDLHQVLSFLPPFRRQAWYSTFVTALRSRSTQVGNTWRRQRLARRTLPQRRPALYFIIERRSSRRDD